MAKHSLGVGVTTFNRPEHLKWCLDNINKHTKDFKLFVYDDAINRRGVAYGKNMCLYNLRDCDHIVLVDDDTAPIKEGWTDYFINSGYHHLLYMIDHYGVRKVFNDFTSYRLSSGCFMYMTKECIKKAGYFNPDYGLYGYEHAGYSTRIFTAGLTPYMYMTLNKTSEYIYSLDHNKGGFGLDHKCSISEEERTKLLELNNPTYIKEATTNKPYCDFKP